jgi:hypothetical protein
MYTNFEEYIARLLFEVPMPSRNQKVKVKLFLPATENLPEEVLELTTPFHSELPQCNPEHIETLLLSLDAERIRQLLKNVLLDMSNLFISCDK